MKVSSPRKGTELLPRVFASWQEQVNRAIRNLGFVRAISFTFTNDFASIPAHDQAALTVTVEGARQGAAVVVNVGNTGFAVGLIFDGKVSTDDQVRVRANNVTDAAVDVGSKPYSGVVFNL